VVVEAITLPLRRFMLARLDSESRGGFGDRFGAVASVWPLPSGRRIARSVVFQDYPSTGCADALYLAQPVEFSLRPEALMPGGM
jgi:hypothetical protein